MALLVKVDSSGNYVFVPSTDGDLNLSLLHKGQQDLFLQYIRSRHPLPPQLKKRLDQSLWQATLLGRLQWCFCCTWCCDSRSWDMDRDPDMLLQHIKRQLVGILEPGQYEILEQIQSNAEWSDGRTLLRLYLTDPSRYQA